MLLETKKFKLHGLTATLAAGVMTERHKGRKVIEGLDVYTINCDRDGRSPCCGDA
jgi:hypothetical protein